MSEQSLIAFAEKLLALLEEGSFSSTYKFAVILGLLDVCLERTEVNGWAPESVTTRQLAAKVTELYWPHTTGFIDVGADVLRQNRTGQAEIVKLVAHFRSTAAGDASLPLAAARALAPKAFERVLTAVEWKLVEMPLPKLQRFGGELEPFIYDIRWDDTITRRRFASRDFDNLIRFTGHAGDLLVQLGSLIRPIVQRRWAAMVASMNSLQEARLERFLFGVERVATAPVRGPLLELQSGRCFYCAARITRDSHVDHFVPWARYPNDDVENLVVADAACNGAKRDFLADADHLRRWIARTRTHAADLRSIAESHRWSGDATRSLAVARAIYLRLPAGAKLWRAGREFTSLDPAPLAAALA